MTVQCKTKNIFMRYKPVLPNVNGSSYVKAQLIYEGVGRRLRRTPHGPSEGRPDWNSGGYENLTEHKQSPNTPPTHRECHPQNKTSREACVNHTHTLSCSIWRSSHHIIKARAQVEWNQAWAELEMSPWEGDSVLDLF